MANAMSFPYVVEYAKSGRANCVSCRKGVEKDELRIAKIIQSSTHDGTISRWYHIECFFNSKLRRPSSVAEIGNYDNIRWRDQQMIKHQIEPADSSEPGTSGSPPAKRRKINQGDSEGKQMKKQNDMIYEIRDKLINIKPVHRRHLLSYNQQGVPEGESAMLDALADAMVFGALKRCKKCTGNFVYVSRRGYKCTGDATEWTNCDVITQDPSRIEFIVPEHLTYDSPFLQSYVSNVRKRIVQAEASSTSATTTSGASVETSSTIMSGSESRPNTVTLRVKNSGVVDPDSGLAEETHVYQRGTDNYSVTLGKTSIERDKNSFYILQILEHDEGNGEYYLFRKWGRIGTDRGDSTTQCLSLDECIERFEILFSKKTENEWSSRANFVKVANKMYPVDTDYGVQDCRNYYVKSILKKPVQRLIKLIFDVNMMKQVLCEYNLDLNEMPLGRVAEGNLFIAYRVLKELWTYVREMNQSGNFDRIKIMDASNRFYTLVPHSFGTAEPPIIDTEKDIIAKFKMMDTLLEIEIACRLRRLDINSDEPQNPLDVQYEELNTEIDVLDNNSVEYSIIKQYLNNTHGHTHDHFELDIEQVFVIKRQDEEERYEPYSQYSNRKLLWHGSRLCNYAGILSQGLRMAPGVAQYTGDMFGKGIYFSDIVSKSANYCYASIRNTTGLLLLCEVALGNMYECLTSENITNLPDGKHSTKGLGRMQPDPTMIYRTEDGVEIPYGTVVPTGTDVSSSLMYNEYVVYEPAQVKLKYLVQVNFKLSDEFDL